MRTGFDGTSCIMVRYRGSVEVQAEEVTATECTPCGLVAEDAAYVYTDDWKDDLNDLPLYGEVKEIILQINKIAQTFVNNVYLL